jgi:DNA polymerase beta
MKIKLHKANGEPFKMKAYVKAIDKLKQNVQVISSIDDVKSYKFGKSIHEKSCWLLRNDTNLPEIEDMSATVSFIEELTTIHNIGVSKAKELVNKHNIKSISELREHLDLLNDKQKIGLKYHEHMQQRIPRAEIERHEELIRKTFATFHKTCQCEIVGSYRRQALNSGDIDVVVSFRDNKVPANFMKKLIQHFQEMMYVPSDGIFALGNKKFMGMCKLSNESTFRRIDILITNLEEYPFAMLYFTGSGDFNVKMREHANTIGYSLNEKNLTKIENNEEISVPMYDEKDIFDFLKIQYLSPKDRSVTNFKVLCN